MILLLLLLLLLQFYMGFRIQPHRQRPSRKLVWTSYVCHLFRTVGPAHDQFRETSQRKKRRKDHNIDPYPPAHALVFRLSLLSYFLFIFVLP